MEKNVNDNGMPVELWQSATGITRNWQFLSDLQPYMLNFLENHDEQRYTSDFFGKDNSNAFAPLFVSLYLNTAPFMIYFGEEVGEKGMDEEGFSGKDGRTTIFDWWSIGSVRRLRKVIRNGVYESMSPSKLTKAGMKPEEAAFFCRFAQAVRFAASDEAVRRGTTYDLCYCNYSSDGFNKDKHFVFLRDFEEHTLLIAANFSQSECRMNITIPSHAFEWMGIPVTESVYPGSVIEITVPPMDAAVLQIV